MVLSFGKCRNILGIFLQFPKCERIDKMILTYKEAYKKYKNDYGIEKAINNNEIYKVSRGIYSDKKNLDLMAIYSKKYPNAIITMDSAFYFYKLTDFIPQKVYLSISRHARPIKEDDIVISYIDDKIFKIGRCVKEIDGEKINIYDLERLLVELIRKKSQIPYDYYKEIINNYRKIADSLDMYKIEEYLALFKNEVNLSNTLLSEVF